MYHAFGVLSSPLLFVTVLCHVSAVGLTFVCWCGIGSSVFCGFRGAPFSRLLCCCVACYYCFIRRALVFVAGAYVRGFVCARVEGCPEVWVISTRGFWWIGRLILGSGPLWVYSGGDCLASWIGGS